MQIPLILQVYQVTGEAVRLTPNVFVHSSPMLFSFEWYSKVSVTESLILKSLLCIESRILNSIPFKEMKKKCHTYVGIYIHITVIPIIENGEMLHQLLNSGGISWTFIFYTITTVVKMVLLLNI